MSIWLRNNKHALELSYDKKYKATHYLNVNKYVWKTTGIFPCRSVNRLLHGITDKVLVYLTIKADTKIFMIIL